MGEQRSTKTGLATVIMAGIVCIICILSSAGVLIAFIFNAPW